VLDETCRDILAPILKVGDLRALGITLLLSMKDDNRQQIPDAPAVYFMMPTEENIQRLVQDCVNDLYQSIQVHFAMSISRKLLEYMADQLVQHNVTHKIDRLFDQFVNFKCIEQNFFTLGMNNVLSRLFDPSNKEESDIRPLIDQTASGITSVCMTSLYDNNNMNSNNNRSMSSMGSSNSNSSHQSCPLIVYPNRGTPATLVGQTVAKTLKNMNRIELSHYYDASSSSSSSSSTTSSLLNKTKTTAKKRPLVIVLDRSVDYSVCLQHQWLYRPLIHDLFSIHLNRIHVNSTTTTGTNNSNTTKQEKEKVYEIESDDMFWSRNKNVAFPNVAEHVSEQLDHHKKQLREFNQRTGLKIDEQELLSKDSTDENGNTVPSSSNAASSSVMTKQMIDQVFQLASDRKKVEMHTNIAHSILKQVDQRQLDKFYGIEEQLIKNEPLIKADLIDLLEGGGGTIEDRVRLLCICYLHRITYDSMYAHSSSGLQSPSFDHSLSMKEIEQYEQKLAQLRASTNTTAADDQQQNSSNDDNNKTLPELAFFRMMSSQFHNHFEQQNYHHLDSNASSDSGFSDIADSVRKSFKIFGESYNRIKSTFTSTAQHTLPTSRIVKSLVYNNLNSLMKDESFEMIDPLSDSGRLTLEKPTSHHHSMSSSSSSSLSSSLDASATNNNCKYSHVIVFVVGGGHYLEYHHLNEMFNGDLSAQQRDSGDLLLTGGSGGGFNGGDPYNNNNNPIPFLYGCTDVLTGEYFLKQLGQVGAKIPQK